MVLVPRVTEILSISRMLTSHLLGRVLVKVLLKRLSVLRMRFARGLIMLLMMSRLAYVPLFRFLSHC